LALVNPHHDKGQRPLGTRRGGRRLVREPEGQPLVRFTLATLGAPMFLPRKIAARVARHGHGGRPHSQTGPNRWWPRAHVNQGASAAHTPCAARSSRKWSSNAGRVLIEHVLASEASFPSAIKRSTSRRWRFTIRCPSTTCRVAVSISLVSRFSLNICKLRCSWSHVGTPISYAKASACQSRPTSPLMPSPIMLSITMTPIPCASRD
jgi:hypothetical protein